MLTTEDFISKKIIVIDDSRTVRVEVIAILRELGFLNIQEAIDGKDAWKSIAAEGSANEPFELILSDINMPKMTGLQLLKKIKATACYSKVPVIMISAESEQMTILESISEGASDYILKPFNKKVVKDKILAVLAR